MYILYFWRDIYSLKIFFVFSIMIFLGILNISCSSGKKEMRNEQNSHLGTSVLTASMEKKVTQDSAFLITLQKHTSTINDTVVGIIYVAGNEPFTHLILALSPSVQYLIETDSSSRAQLWQLQGKKVNIIGIKKTTPMGISIQTSSFQQSP